jgi:uncharacterized delta-60 repeat protein
MNETIVALRAVRSFGGARRIFLPVALSIAVAAHAEVVVTGPPGLDADSWIGTLPAPPILFPLFEQMPLKNRMDMSLVFTNRTGATQIFTGGTITLRDAAGAVIAAAPLSPAEFIVRRTLNTGGTFDSGPVVVGFGADYDTATLTSAASLPLGGVVAAGWARKISDGKQYSIVTRMLLDGALDTSFSGNGMVPGAQGRCNAVALQNDGKIVLAGTDGSDFQVQRLEVDGTEDTSFGPNGTRATSLGGNSQAFAVAVDSEGRVVVAGSVNTGGLTYQFALVRYTSAGGLDTTFDRDGIVITDIAGSSSESIQALRIDSSGRIVGTGWGFVGGKWQMLVARYHTNGALDTAFSGDGVVLSPLAGADQFRPNALAIDRAGRLVVGGTAWQGSAQHFGLARILGSGVSAGSFDTTFDGDGQMITDLPETDNENCFAVAAISGDKILSAGQALGEEDEFFAIAQHTSSGALDPTFSGDGQLLAQINLSDKVAKVASARSVVPLSLGGFIVAGNATIEGTAYWAFMRYDSDGSPYTTATVPPNAQVTLRLNDFPFTTDIKEQPFDGFDPKQTPARLDAELNFQRLAQPLRITGIDLRVWTQNGQPYRFPLHDPSVSGAKWHVGGAHERGTGHALSWREYFHWDVGAVIGSSGLIPDLKAEDVAPAEYLDEWAMHPNYDPGRTYLAAEVPNCAIGWGQPIYSCGTGTVLVVTNDNLDNFPNGDSTFRVGKNYAGNHVIIDHGGGQYGLYAHMQMGSVLVTTGQQVSAGTKLGVIGTSGNTGGPHLHFGLVDTPDALGQSVPMYFIDAKFTTASDGTGPVVRQLRAAPRTGDDLIIDPSPIPFSSPGPTYGPGPVAEIGAAHDSTENPQRLMPPVSVQGSIGSTPGTAMADGGDIIEDVYRFTVAEPGATVWVRLEFPAGADLDVLLYDQTLQAVLPAAGKTLARPETFYATVPKGTYYVCVSRYDPSGNTPVNYTLHLTAYPGGRPIYVDWESACAVPFGNPVCGGGWGGPYPTVRQGHDAAYPNCGIFIRGNHTYPEKITLRNPTLIRSYNGNAVINP